MRQDLIYIAETLKSHDRDLKCIIRNKIAQNISSPTQVEKLPDHGITETLYIIKSSSLPKEKPAALPAQLLCIQDSPLPEWVLKDCECNLIVTVADLSETQINRTLASVRNVQRQFSHISDRIMEAMHYGQGIQAIADISSDALGSTVAFLDTNWKVLAISKNRPCTNPLMQKALEGGYMSNCVLENMKRDGWFDRLRKNGQMIKIPPFPEAPDIHGVFWCYIRINGVVGGYMVVYADRTPLTDYQQEWIPMLTRFAAMELQRIKESSPGYASAYEALMLDLLESKITDPKMAAHRMKLLEQKIERNLHVIVIRKMIRDFPEAISAVERAGIQALFPGCLSVIYQNSLALLVSSSDGSIPARGGDMEAVVQDLRLSNLAAGVSNQFDDISQLVRYYQQAARALRFAWNISSKSGMFHYSDYALYHSMELCARHVNLRDLCHPGVLTLWEDAGAGNRELFQTLYLYLLYMKDIVRVTQSLNIHRSTLFYRLNKIKSITGADLDDGNVIAQLLYSFKIIEYLDVFAENAEF